MSNILITTSSNISFTNFSFSAWLRILKIFLEIFFTYPDDLLILILFFITWTWIAAQKRDASGYRHLQIAFARRCLSLYNLQLSLQDDIPFVCLQAAPGYCPDINLWSAGTHLQFDHVHQFILFVTWDPCVRTRTSKPGAANSITIEIKG